MPKVKDILERYQIWIYFTALFLGFFLGTTEALFNKKINSIENAINPVIALMLFTTFLQVPVIKLKTAILDIRFLCALLLTNFIAIPILVAALLSFLPQSPLLQLGILLVLLTPCIDYVVTFTHLGNGNAQKLLAATPILLISQMVLLPVYLKLFLGNKIANFINLEPFINAFLWLIFIPLVMAALIQTLAIRIKLIKIASSYMELLTVPATATVLLSVMILVIPQIRQATDAAYQALPFYILFAILAPCTGFIISRYLGLKPLEQRTIIFSAATRNSLVILPFAFAIPQALPIVPTVIITQTIVELISEMIYIRVVPCLIKNDK